MKSALCKLRYFVIYGHFSFPTGLRVSLVLSVFLMFVGTGLRCVTSDHDVALW